MIDYLNFVKPWDAQYRHDTATNVTQLVSNPNPNPNPNTNPNTNPNPYPNPYPNPNPNPFPNPNQVKQLMCWRETYAKCGAATPEVGEI